MNLADLETIQCLCSEVCPGSSHDAYQAISIQAEILSYAEEKYPLPITLPGIKPEPKVDQRSKPLMIPTSDSDERIRRPPNAFIIFGNEWRPKLAAEYPEERNKNISVRLGNMWRAMKSEEKKKYMDMARQADAKHREKYPGYTYSPKEARIQKVLRAVTRDLRGRKNVKGRKTVTTRHVKRARSHHNPVPSRGTEPMNILHMIPMANFAAPILITIPTVGTQKEETSATSSNKNSKNSSASTQPTGLEITSTLSDKSGGFIGTENTNSPLPSFEQASGSMEIGCFSYEELVNSTIQQTENHQSTSNEGKEPVTILDMIPMANFAEPILVNIPTAAMQKEQTSATSSNKNSKNSSASTQPTALEITSDMRDNSGGFIGTENTNSPLPSFEQASGSMEIGCFSYEELVSNTIQETENHQFTSNKNPNPLEFKLLPYESYVEGLLPESEFMNEILALDSVASLGNQF